MHIVSDVLESIALQRTEFMCKSAEKSRSRLLTSWIISHGDAIRLRSFDGAVDLWYLYWGLRLLLEILDAVLHC